MKIREVLTYIVIGVLVLFSGQQYFAMRSFRNEVENQPNYKPYRLPDDVVTTAQLEGHMMKVISRVEGDTTYIVEEYYIPQESSVEYIVSTDTLVMEQLEQAQILLWQLQQQVQSPEDSIKVDSLQAEINRIRMMVTTTEIKYDSHGWCMVPELGIGIDSHFDPNIEAGARLYYYNRFGAGLHGAITLPIDSAQVRDASVGIFLDWRVPGLDNSAIFGSFDHEFTSGQNKGMLGWQVYLR
jgi:hypothetical protein